MEMKRPSPECVGTRKWVDGERLWLVVSEAGCEVLKLKGLR